MLRLVTVCRQAKAFSFYSGHPYVCTAIIKVLPVVVGAHGTVKNRIVVNIKKVSERAIVTETQKICMLQRSARILRKVLSV